jgi:hypothetical protein
MNTCNYKKCKDPVAKRKNTDAMGKKCIIHRDMLSANVKRKRDNELTIPVANTTPVTPAIVSSTLTTDSIEHTHSVKKSKTEKDQIEEIQRHSETTSDGTIITDESAIIRSRTIIESMEITNTIKQAVTNYVAYECKKQMEMASAFPRGSLEDMLEFISRPQIDTETGSEDPYVPYYSIDGSIGSALLDIKEEWKKKKTRFNEIQLSCAFATITFFERMITSGKIPPECKEWKLLSITGKDRGGYSDPVDGFCYPVLKNFAFNHITQLKDGLGITDEWTTVWLYLGIKLENGQFTKITLPGYIAKSIFTNATDSSLLQDMICDTKEIEKNLTMYSDGSVIQIIDERGQVTSYQDMLVKDHPELKPILLLSEKQDLDRKTKQDEYKKEKDAQRALDIQQVQRMSATLCFSSIPDGPLDNSPMEKYQDTGSNIFSRK